MPQGTKEWDRIAKGKQERMLLNTFWYGQAERKPVNMSSGSIGEGTKGVMEGDRNTWKKSLYSILKDLAICHQMKASHPKFISKRDKCNADLGLGRINMPGKWN